MYAIYLGGGWQPPNPKEPKEKASKKFYKQLHAQLQHLNKINIALIRKVPFPLTAR